MEYSSHRLRVKEKQVAKKFLLSGLLLIASIVFAIFIGLPLMAKLAVGISLLKGEENKTSQGTSIPVFPPIIEELPSATNSASIAISVFAQKEQTVVLSVNGEKKAEEKTDETGKVRFRGVTLSNGENKIQAGAKENEKESEPSQTLIFYKKEPPKLEIHQPEE